MRVTSLVQQTHVENSEQEGQTCFRDSNTVNLEVALDL